MIRKLFASTAVTVALVAGLVGGVASPAAAHSYCKKVSSVRAYDPPQWGYACAYQNRWPSASEKQREIRLYKNGVRRATVWVTAWSSRRALIWICDSKVDGIGVRAKYQWQDSWNRPRYRTIHPSGGGKCDWGSSYSMTQYRAYLYKSDRYGTVWYRWPIGSF